MNTVSALSAQNSQLKNHLSNQVAFGKLFKNGNEVAGLYVCPEPISHGGLGKIGQELPIVFKDELGVPLLKVFPLLEPLKTQKQDLLATFKLKDWRGKDMEFRVVELAPEKGVRRIAIQNEEMFGQFKSLTDQNSIYQAKKETIKGIGEDVGLKSYIMFNRAVAELVNKHQDKLKQKLSFVIGNDWLTGSTLSQLDKTQSEKLKKIFFFHNHYDEVRKRTKFEEYGLALPDSLKGKAKTSMQTAGHG